MQKTFDILTKIEKTQGTNAKIDLLMGLKDDKFAKWYFETIFDPFLTYGATPSGKLNNQPVTFEMLKQIRDDLASRNVTGDAARQLMNDTCNNIWIVKMWQRDLKIGISESAIGKVFGKSFLKKFELQLCSGHKPGVVSKGWIAEPKYDGVRCVMVFEDGKFKGALSRNGKELYNIEHIGNELNKYIDNTVLDGEIYLKDSNNTISIVKSSKAVKSSVDLKFHVFDCLTPTEFTYRKGTYTLEQRKADLDKMQSKFGAKLKHTEFAPYVKISSDDEAWRLAKKFNKEGYEGAVVKKLDSIYSFKRDNNWMKLKFQDTLDLEVTGYEEGTGRNKGRLGALICKLSNGESVHVGSGYSDDQRDEFWKDRDNLIGKTIEMECQELSEYGIPRFPVFLRVRFDK